MINTGMTTKAYAPTPQESALKVDANQTMSADQREKALKGQDIGSVLNQVADPGWVDPNKVRRVGNNELNKDAFFKLMLAQMKHQDPTNPMQSHEMAAQLAQFSSLEQLNNINQSLDAMKAAQNPTMNTAAIQLVGKTVHADTGMVSRAAGDKVHEVRFNLKADAAEAEVVVSDASGKAVRTLALANLKKGDNKVTWNGMMDDGQVARAGEYRIAVGAKDTAGKKLAVQTAFKGRVTGINFTKEGPVLLVGDQTLRITDIKKIEDDAAKSMQRSSENDVTGKAHAPMVIPGSALMKLPGAPAQEAKAPVTKPEGKQEPIDVSQIPAAEPALVPDIGDVRGTVGG